jgi:hypothetical protein
MILGFAVFIGFVLGALFVYQVEPRPNVNRDLLEAFREVWKHVATEKPSVHGWNAIRDVALETMIKHGDAGGKE